MTLGQRLGWRRPPLAPDAAAIRTLAGLLSETGLTEIEYAIDGHRIRVAREPAGQPAPLVGIAYLAAEPGNPPYVRVGDTVAQGQTLMIIEAMKVMNQIRAPHPGRVAQVYIHDAEPVEYGTALMLIE